MASMMTADPASDATLELDPASARAEPVVSPEEAREFENAALIGGEKLRASGYFVNVVNRQDASPDREGMRTVMVVEDDPGTAAVIEAVLKKHGFATRVGANLQGILRGLNASPRPDAILLDILLPDVNGFAVLQRLRRHPELGRIPVVMLSSLSEPADVAKGLALGATGYLSKPARPQTLVEAIRGVLGL